MTLFLQGIQNQRSRLGFSGLQARLIQKLRENVRNGMFTERGLARKAGISQPHMHNLLKGARTLSAESADALLGAMSWSVLDLLAPDEAGTDAALSEEPEAAVPLLSGAAGPG